MAKPTLQRARKSARHVFVNCLPHALLVIAYLLYLIFGTLIFQAIEGHGSSALENYLDDVAETRGKLEAAMRNETPGKSGNLTKLLDEYTDMISKPEWKLGRLHTAQDGMAWRFSSTMLFCVITITTIGYGDIVPVTKSGKIFVGFYATFGIPLNVIFLADIGYLLAKLIIAAMQASKLWRSRSQNKMIASRPPVRGMRPTQKDRRNDQNGIFASRALSIHGPKSVVVKVDSERPMRMQSSLRRGITSKSVMSVHGPKSVATSERTKTKSNLYPHIKDTSFANGGTTSRDNDGLESVNLQAVSTDVTARSQDHLVINEEQPKCSPIELKTFQNSDKAVDKIKSGATELNTNVESQNNILEDHTEVPLIVVLLILIVYVLVGAGMMSKIEDWNYGDALYFTFITFTTIGFGDMAPSNYYGDNFFFVCIIYIVLGLAVVSTCIALTQAKILRAIDRFTAWIRSYS